MGKRAYCPQCNKDYKRISPVDDLFPFAKDCDCLTNTVNIITWPDDLKITVRVAESD